MKLSKFLKKYKVLLLSLIFLILLTPLAFKVAERFNSGDAWGEWSSDEVQKMTGISPEGMKKVENLYDKAPFRDYSLPEGLGISEEFAYLFSGVAGIIVILVLFFSAMKIFSRRTWN